MARKRLSPLAQNLKRIRLERGITQETLAAKAGYTRQAISRVEAGRSGVTLRGLATIARILRVTSSDLLDETPRPERAA